MSRVRSAGTARRRAPWPALLAAVAAAFTHAGTSARGAMADPPPAAPDEVRVLSTGTRHDALYDIAVDGRRAYAVGAFGAVLASVDGGATWARQGFPMNSQALLSIAAREGRCVAVGQAGAIFSADDCVQWKAVTASSKSRLLSVGMNRNGRVIAVGAFGTILQSTDWGKTWLAAKVDWSGITADGAEPHLYDVHVADDNVVTVVGEFELILRSTGATWTVVHKGERSLFGLTVRDGGQAYAVGQSGALLFSADAGATWRSLKSPTAALLTAVYAGKGGALAVAGINTLLRSRDAGASWSPIKSRAQSCGWIQDLAASEIGGRHRLLGVGACGAIVEISQ